MSKQVGDRQARFKNRKTLSLRAATGPKSEKQRQRNPKPPQVDGKVRFQVLDRDNSLATTGTDLNSSIVRRTIEAPSQ